MRLIPQGTVRNAVVVVGAHNLSLLIVLPVTVALAWLLDKWGRGVPIPAVATASALLAGVIGGWLIVSPNPARWALALVFLVFITSFSGVRWYRPPTRADRAVQVAEAALPAIVAGLAFMYCSTVVRRNAAAA